MSRAVRLALLLPALAALMLLPAVADAQGRGRRPAAPGKAPVVRGQIVFVGGYFYDPYFGPYPWWPRTAYPRWYFPRYDNRAELRIIATPKDAAVYVDGFYAGIVDDFDGAFQSLPLPPGGHEVVLYLEGYRTARWKLYLQPGGSMKLRQAMEPLPAGVASERPHVAPPVPPPPAGTFTAPKTAPRDQPPSTEPAPLAKGFGTLELRVQPAAAVVRIDGDPWVSSDDGFYSAYVGVGTHRIEITLRGYQPFSTEIDVREGSSTPLNVILSPRR
jgi:hypothetical protein